MSSLAQKFFVAFVAVFLTALARGSVAADAAPVSEDAVIRKTVLGYWEDIKARRYEDAYARLASSVQASMSAPTFTRAMQAFDATYTVDGVEITGLRRHLDHAVIDTRVTGFLVNPAFPAPVPMRIDGQTVLVKEAGKWRFATGNDESRRRYFAEHSERLHAFQFHPDIVYLKQGENWVALADVLAKLLGEAGVGKAPSVAPPDNSGSPAP